MEAAAIAAAGLRKTFKKKKTPWKIKEIYIYIHIYMYVSKKDQLPDLICSVAPPVVVGATA